MLVFYNPILPTSVVGMSLELRLIWSHYAICWPFEVMTREIVSLPLTLSLQITNTLNYYEKNEIYNFFSKVYEKKNPK